MFYPDPKKTKQTRICGYLEAISSKKLSEEAALDSLIKSGYWFIIGEEIVREKSTARYFKLFFLDVDFEDPWRIMSSTESKKGILQVDSEGHLQILSSGFLPMASNVYFNFHDGKLALEIDDFCLAASSCAIM